MISGTFKAAILAAIVDTSVAVDASGSSISLGPTTSTIIKAVTTIIPGTALPTQNGVRSRLTTFESWPDNSWCGAKKGKSCVQASLFGSFGQLSGDASAAVTDADTGTKPSSFEHKSGPFMRGYGTGTECNANCNAVITLESPDNGFSKTIATAQKATNTFKKINVPAMVGENQDVHSVSLICIGDGNDLISIWIETV
ncbi:hypothetical protein HER10_EVM0001319 [Colletotrichum scovillei]|uniref:uncharacterized protein n=1 Tax=Colletotrichum scovillei TaxID=1209932 RepID=UPI0015C3615C|nr:uncharacterized protein HER10_EVM0001319 [Colletotrichum scovillei]KAF4782641.1 hypothetical protein HER10_EVM0001319 [Colletotrichum scovillei]